MTMAAEPMAHAERLWREWLDWAAGQGGDVPAVRDPAFEETRARVWEASDFVATTVARYPETFAQLLASGDLDRPYPPGEMNLALTAALADLKPGVADDDALKRRLRLFRRREMLRLIWRDLGGAAALEETLEDLSELADVCVNQALDWTQAWTRAELGTPRDAHGAEQELLVIGMGKLGARELNMSSDIDLILAYPEAGQVDGPRPLTNEQFFIRLGQRLVRALDAPTVDGFVFRVDTRLRPFGDSGPLAMSFTAMEYYYQDQAREWERYAMVKARVVAGPRDRRNSSRPCCGPSSIGAIWTLAPSNPSAT
jgi:glutamate-ammonia-ligase adenylyltransferase